MSDRGLCGLKVHIFHLNFLKMGLSALHFAFLDKNFLTRRFFQFSDSQKFKGKGMVSVLLLHVHLCKPTTTTTVCVVLLATQ